MVRGRVDADNVEWQGFAVVLAVAMEHLRLSDLTARMLFFCRAEGSKLNKTVTFRP